MRMELKKAYEAVTEPPPELLYELVAAVRELIEFTSGNFPSRIFQRSLDQDISALNAHGVDDFAWRFLHRVDNVTELQFHRRPKNHELAPPTRAMIVGLPTLGELTVLESLPPDVDDFAIGPQWKRDIQAKLSELSAYIKPIRWHLNAITWDNTWVKCESGLLDWRDRLNCRLPADLETHFERCVWTRVTGFGFGVGVQCELTRLNGVLRLEFSCRLLQSRFRPGNEHQVHATAGKLFGKIPADSRRCSRNDCPAAIS